MNNSHWPIHRTHEAFTTNAVCDVWFCSCPHWSEKSTISYTDIPNEGAEYRRCGFLGRRTCEEEGNTPFPSSRGNKLPAIDDRRGAKLFKNRALEASFA